MQSESTAVTANLADLVTVSDHTDFVSIPIKCNATSLRDAKAFIRFHESHIDITCINGSVSANAGAAKIVGHVGLLVFEWFKSLRSSNKIRNVEKCIVVKIVVKFLADWKVGKFLAFQYKIYLNDQINYGRYKGNA